MAAEREVAAESRALASLVMTKTEKGRSGK
jgi:hypothetical protein